MSEHRPPWSTPRRCAPEETLARLLPRLPELGITRCTLFVVADNEDGAAYWKHTGWRERVDLKAMAKDLL